MRVQPRAWIGLVVWALYLAVVVVIQASSGISYSEFGDSAENLWRGAVLSLAVGAVLVAVVTTWLGWWRPALRERRPTKARWTIIAPALLVVAVIGNLAATDWNAVGTDFVLAAVTLGVLVGFNEELTSRGLFLTGLRSSTREVWVALLSSLLFGLMHGVNIFLGQSVGETAVQVGQAFLQGLVFYILRRVTGSLIWAMPLHGAWDVSTFTVGLGDASSPLGIFVLLAALFALVTFRFAARDAGEGADQPALRPENAPG
ncbi:CPBP family intramembrane glutamic endopeptidase [Cellulomonas rhizosphaerae]|uniref:CPBP family intramembrane glutamic endopeptidase n=1 Tax=Cellulomonas rhizosphaerae TaxID=2293719 RepID=UPI001314AB71|nr:CPBP family intramembrane glutamic endopeptidase [Cellulomonas rhizosphaerae]